VDFVFQRNESCLQKDETFIARDRPWGTGHAILCARDKINNNFLVVNADDVYGPGPIGMMANFIKNIAPTEDIFGCAGYLLRKTLSSQGCVSRGICESDSGGNLLNIREDTGIQRNISGEITNGSGNTLDENTIVSMNLWGFTPRIFNYLEIEWRRFLEEHRFSPTKEFFITMAINRILMQKKISIKLLKTEAQWVGVTYKDDNQMVDNEINRLTDNGIYPPALW
jgi:UTP-glucose-1-phosphate uridylyltransferase